MSKMRLRHVGPVSMGVFMGVFYAILGLVIGLPMSVIAVLGAAGAKDAATGVGSLMFGAFAVIAIPAAYGAMAFVMGCFMGWLYNVVASITGGIEVTIE
jgi:hypothetical protein